MRLVLVGQPNCGKSTLFNAVAGYRAATANFPGKSVTFTIGRVLIDGEVVDLVDLPGTYSISTSNPAELEARNYLLSDQADVVVNVIDAAMLARSLELSLELLSLGKPMVVCLNMMDEADRKGTRIDVAKLSKALGVPVVAAIAVKGEGIPELFRTARRVTSSPHAIVSSGTLIPLSAFRSLGEAEASRPGVPVYSPDVEAALTDVGFFITEEMIEAVRVPKRFLAEKLLEEDPAYTRLVADRFPRTHARIVTRSSELAKHRGRPAGAVVAAERHALALELFESVATVGVPIRGLRDRFDAALMHRFWGYVFLLAILFGFFQVVFRLGKRIEDPMVAGFDALQNMMSGALGADHFAFFFARGIVQGVAGGAAIVLPYLVPFLIGLALLEDFGYIPRVAFLMDALMHRIGLHGKSVIPFILGYGCSVPAVMATRILESPRDRFITGLLATMVPCAARTTIILALVGAILGPSWAMGIYFLNIVIIGIAGMVLTRLMPEVTPGLILEMPSYKVPSLRVVLAKSWFRIREFVWMAWPILIGSSIVMSLLEYAHADKVINAALSPLTLLLGLPIAVGTTLVFGVLRKELSMLMLFQALGTFTVGAVMTHVQLVTFTLFVIFYIPCVATISVLTKELGWRGMGLVTATTVGIALATAMSARLVLGLF